jgi:nucleotide-binding universal stress UspA family protein
MTTASVIEPVPSSTVTLFERVLCGLDGSPESYVAARQAATVLEQGGSLRFLSAISPVLLSPPAFGAVSVVHELEEAARAHLAEARARWPQATTELGYGPAAAALLGAARDQRATLLAVGSRDGRRLPGIVLGRVTTHLLHRAPCSVLVARERDGGLAFPRAIVVGTDGSIHAEQAVLAARRLGERFGVPVRAVVATGGDTVDVDGLCLSDRLEWSDRRPVDALVAAAAGADLVVLGTRGLRGARALGSVSERVAHAAPCSVLVVHHEPSRESPSGPTR